MSHNLTEPTPSMLAKEVDKLASQCVKCALCLPHCPTYEQTEDENESPRGRIALFQALAKQQLPLTAKAKNHLDLCLGCRACERVCPAHVEYGQLLVEGRAELAALPAQEALPSPHFSSRFISTLARKPKSMRVIHQLLWWLQISGLRQLGRFLKIPTLLQIKDLDQLLPKVTKPVSFQTEYEPIASKQGQVMLFTGCLTSLADQETLAASIHVLRHMGYAVTIPSGQTCCGAIDLHAGDLENAKALAEQNRINLGSQVQILTLATGCSAVLQEYNIHYGSEFSPFAAQIMDINTFILQHWPSDLELKPLPYSVMLHTPCTRRNVLKSIADPGQLLSKIPQLTLRSLSSPHCCGAAGTYMLDHPEMAQSLVKNLLAEIKDQPLEYLASTNIGCALHMQQYLQQFKPKLQVVHPITLLARALGA